MKRLFSISFVVLALIISAAGTAPAAHAVHIPGAVLPAGADPFHGDTQQAAQDLQTAGESSTPVPGQTAAQAQQAINSAAGAPSPAGSKEDDTYNGIMIKIMQLFAWLAGVAMITLDYAAYYTVVKMGNFINGFPAIGLTWSILRDIGNIMLIFGFLAVGVTTILNVDWYGGGKKMLPMMFVAAVFLNFSLFISEAFIDVGNLFATQFYTQINGGSAEPASLTIASATDLGNRGISAKIMSQLGLTTIYGDLQHNDRAKVIFKDGSPWIIGFMSILLFIVLAFVLFSLAFVLIARFVILLFLIIVSPVAFAGLAVPGLSARMKQWWDKLFEQIITAPILFLMLYIALRIITDSRFLTGFGGGREWLGTATNNIAGFASVLLSFLVAMGLLIAVVIQSKNLSAFGASWASRMGGRLSFGAVSLAGRATLGSAGNLLAGKRMQSWARTGGLGGLLLKGAVLGGKGLRGATYDVRNAPGAATGLGAMDIDAGKGATLTARQVHEAQYGWKPTKEWLEHAKEEREQAGREMDFKAAQGAIVGEKAKLAAGTINQAQYDVNVAPHEKVITDALGKMSTKELEQLSGIKKGMDELVQNLSPQQFEALMKSDKLTEGEKGKIKESRYHPLGTAIASGNVPEVKKVISSFSKGELESIPASALANPLVHDNLSDKQRDTLTDSKERTAAEKDLIRKSSPVGKVDATFRDPTLGGPAGAAALLRNLSSSQVAKLHTDILTDHDIIDKFTPAMLVALQEEKKLSAAQVDTIRRNIMAGVGSAALRTYITIGPGAAFWS